ncbi:MAG TPA: hypothetical protein VGG79_04535 [Roseiarcus sp.]|jgi:hypothetical protein
MKHALAGLLLAGTTCVAVLVTPAFAQVAGNPGDLHTPTVYTSRVDAQTYGYGGLLGPLDALTAPGTGQVAAAPGGGAPCGVVQDFNGRYTALCGL